MVGAASVVMVSHGANPASGSMGTASAPLTWTGTATGTGSGTGETACNEGVNCDTFTLTVNGTQAEWLAADMRIQVLVHPPTAADDYDLYIHKGSNAGPRVSSSGNGPGADDVAYITPSKDGTGVFTVRVTYSTTSPASQYRATATVVSANPAPAPIAGQDNGPKVGYENFEAPGVFTMTAQSNGNTIEWLGRGAGEPSIGVNWKSAAPNDAAGVTNFQSDLQSLFVTFNDACTTGTSKATWANRHAPTQAGVDSDPIGFTNVLTGRVFAGELTLLSPTCKISYTDNDGVTWVATAGPNGAAVDHQTIAGGPYHTIAGQQPPNTVAGGAFYYCSQDLVTAYCMRSDDGGNTWTANTPWSTGCNSQLHGHVKVAPDGSVYIPNKNCSAGNGGVGVSTDNGATWTVYTVTNTAASLGVGLSVSDPAVGIDKANKVYFAQASNDSSLTVATSTDNGKTWANFSNVTGALGIKGVRFPAAVGGDSGRAAVAFLGTKTDGNFNGSTFWGVWHMYIAHTFDGGVTWTVSDATPDLPAQRGCIWSGGGGEICRNLLDFFDIAIDKQGRVQVGWVNGCPGGACALAPAGAKGNDYSATSTITRQSSGRRMIAAFDPPSPMTATSLPGVPTLTVYRVGTIARLAWSLADTGNSIVTGFYILRGTTSGNLVQIATVAGDQSRYDDKTATDTTKTYYYAVQATNGVGASCSKNEVAAPYMGDSCPGLAIHQNDPTHQESAQVQNGANPNLAIDWFSVAEPITDLKNGATVVAAAGTYLKFTMKVTNLTTVPPDSRWRMVWDSYDSPGRLFFVGMRTDPASVPSFNYGIVGDAGLPAVLVLSEQSPQVALAGSNFNADGTITVYVPKSGVGNPNPGDLLGALGGKTFTGDAGAAGNYQRSTALVDHTFVKGVTDNSFPATAYLLRDAAHLTDNHVPVVTSLSASTVYGNPPLAVNFTSVGYSDADGDVTGSYRYTFSVGGTPQTKSCGAYPTPNTTCAATSNTYATPGYYTASMVATDDCGKDSAPVTVSIHVNAPPVANAGTDFSVSQGQTAMLSGARSSDPDNDPLTYAWTQTAGPAVTLSGADTAAPSFVAPSVAADTPLTFELKVTDPLGLNSTARVTVTVLYINPLPVANAGADQSVDEHKIVTLNGAGSDPDREALTYSWTQTAGPAVTIIGAGSATAQFVAPDVSADTPFTFRLTVADLNGTSPPDDVVVTVKNVPGLSPGDVPVIGNASVGALPFYSVLLLGLSGLLRRRRHRGLTPRE